MDEEQEAKPERKKPTYLGAPEIFKLDLACMNLHQAFCVGGEYGGIFLVGSALERPNFRDVDVVCILSDGDFAQTFPDAHGEYDAAHFEFDPRWLLMSATISDWLSAQIGMRVDFKFQPMTFANARHDKARHPLGHRSVARRREAEREEA
jgi:hypothetical protein